MKQGPTQSLAQPKVLAACGAGLMLSAIPLFWLDLPLAGFCRAGETPGDIRTIVRLSESFSHGYGALAILIGVAAVTRAGWRRMRPLIAITYLPGLIVTVIKVSVARRRPNANSDSLPASISESFEGVFPLISQGTEGIDRAVQSFPSGHTSVAVGLAIALSLAFPRGRWFFAVIAGLSAFQRIDVGAHYISDTAFAAGIAFVVAGLLTWIRPVRPFASTTPELTHSDSTGNPIQEEPGNKTSSFTGATSESQTQAA